MWAWSSYSSAIRVEKLGKVALYTQQTYVGVELGLGLVGLGL